MPAPGGLFPGNLKIGPTGRIACPSADASSSGVRSYQPPMPWAQGLQVEGPLVFRQRLQQFPGLPTDGRGRQFHIPPAAGGQKGRRAALTLGTGSPPG